MFNHNIVYTLSNKLVLLQCSNLGLEYFLKCFLLEIHCFPRCCTILSKMFCALPAMSPGRRSRGFIKIVAAAGQLEHSVGSSIRGSAMCQHAAMSGIVRGGHTRKCCKDRLPLPHVRPGIKLTPHHLCSQTAAATSQLSYLLPSALDPPPLPGTCRACVCVCVCVSCCRERCCGPCRPRFPHARPAQSPSWRLGRFKPSLGPASAGPWAEPGPASRPPPPGERAATAWRRSSPPGDGHGVYVAIVDGPRSRWWPIDCRWATIQPGCDGRAAQPAATGPGPGQTNFSNPYLRPRSPASCGPGLPPAPAAPGAASCVGLGRPSR